MKGLKKIIPLTYSYYRFLCFFLQFGLVYFLLDAKRNPIKENISKFEAGQIKIELKLVQVLTKGQAKTTEPAY